MKILVCGGREYRDTKRMWSVLSNLILERYPFGGWPDTSYFTIIGGEARGADSMAKNFAEDMGCKYIGFPADWNKHGKAAGPIRNKQMLAEGEPDLVVAFPGGSGTAHMVRIAVAAGIEVLNID